MEVRELNKDDVLFFILKNKDNKDLMAELNRVTFAFTDKYSNWKKVKKTIHPIYDDFRKELESVDWLDRELIDLLYNKERAKEFGEPFVGSITDSIKEYIYDVEYLIKNVCDMDSETFIDIIDKLSTKWMDINHVQWRWFTKAFSTPERFDSIVAASKKWLKLHLWL